MEKFELPRDAPEPINEPEALSSAFRGRMISSPLYVFQASLNVTVISTTPPDNCIVTCTTFRELLTGFEGQEMLGFNCFCLQNLSGPLFSEDGASMRSVRGTND